MSFECVHYTLRRCAIAVHLQASLRIEAFLLGKAYILARRIVVVSFWLCKSDYCLQHLLTTTRKVR
jgi:hypothetical protein